MVKSPLGRVGWRVAAPAALLLGLLASVGGWLLWHDSQQRAIETVDRYALLLNRLILNDLRGSMEADKRTLVPRTLEEVGRLPAILMVRIVSKSGEVRFASDRRQVGKTLSRDDPTCKACHRPGWEPGTAGATVRFTEASGKTTFRAVDPIVVEPSCRKCHKAAVGEVLGILMTDLDDAALTADRSRAWRSVGLLALGVALVVLTLLAGVHAVVVRRLQDLRRLLGFLRKGARAELLGLRSRDEIDDLARSLESLTCDLDDRLALERAARHVQGTLERHQGAALLLDASGTIVAANRRALMSSRALGPEHETLIKLARDRGWAIPAVGAPGPAVLRVGDEAASFAFLEAWNDEATPDDGPEPHDGEENAETLLYATVLASRIRPEGLRLSGVVDFDRRLAHARRLASDLGRAAAEITRNRETLDLQALAALAVWDRRVDSPEVTWTMLPGPETKLVALRYQIRPLCERLLQVAGAHGGTGSHVLAFTERDPSGQRILLGAWVDRPGAPPEIEKGAGLSLALAICQAHGGEVELDPAFEVKALVATRGFRLRTKSKGSLFLADLEIQRS